MLEALKKMFLLILNSKVNKQSRVISGFNRVMLNSLLCEATIFLFVLIYFKNVKSYQVGLQVVKSKIDITLIIELTLQFVAQRYN